MCGAGAGGGFKRLTALTPSSSPAGRQVSQRLAEEARKRERFRELRQHLEQEQEVSSFFFQKRFRIACKNIETGGVHTVGVRNRKKKKRKEKRRRANWNVTQHVQTKPPPVVEVIILYEKPKTV